MSSGPVIESKIRNQGIQFTNILNWVKLFATGRGRMRAITVLFTLSKFSNMCEGDRECFLRIDNGFLTSCGFETNRFRNVLSLTKQHNYMFILVENCTLRIDISKITFKFF